MIKMSDNNTENKQALSKEEKIEFLKTMFSTLEIDQKAIFTQWCHEQVELGAPALVGQKLQEASDKFNSFIAKVSDNISKGAKFIYEEGNKAFETKDEDVVKNNNIDKGGDDSPSFFS